MNYQEMVKWVFEAMLNGFMAGRPLRSVAEDIVVGLCNIIETNRQAAIAAKKDSNR